MPSITTSISPDSPATRHASRSAAHPPTVNAPGIGPIFIDPTRSVIHVGDTANPITPGQQTTINNIQISFDTSASFIVVGSTQTVELPRITPAPVAPPLVVGGTTIDIGQLVTQLTPGQVTKINGGPISLDISTSFIVIDGTKSIQLVQGRPAPTASSVVIDGSTVNIGQLVSHITPGQVTTMNNICRPWGLRTARYCLPQVPPHVCSHALPP
jgi:hypothetical protein